MLLQLREEYPEVLDRGDMIAATTWSWEGVCVSLDPLAVIDTRASRASPAMARRPASLQGVLTIGVGTTRVGGWRADAVVARRAAATGESPAGDGERQCAHGAGARIDAPHGGRFRMRHQIAERVEAGDVVGELGTFATVATQAGVLTALAARGARIEPGHTLAEVDPRGDVVNLLRHHARRPHHRASRRSGAAQHAARAAARDRYGRAARGACLT